MSIRFTRSNADYLEGSTSPIAAPAFTLSAWFKSDDATARQDVVSLVNSGTVDNYCEIRLRGDSAGDPVQARMNDAGGGSNSASIGGYTANVWHHVAATFSVAGRVYLDGVAGVLSNSQNPSGMNSIGVGRRWGMGTNYFSGNLGPVAFYDRALQQYEISFLAGGGAAHRIPNLVFHDVMLPPGYFDDVAGRVLVAIGSPASVGDHPPVEEIYFPQMGFDVSAAPPNIQTPFYYGHLLTGN